jgi:hypothetical protein
MYLMSIPAYLQNNNSFQTTTLFPYRIGEGPNYTFPRRWAKNPNLTL